MMTAMLMTMTMRLTMMILERKHTHARTVAWVIRDGEAQLLEVQSNLVRAACASCHATPCMYACTRMHTHAWQQRHRVSKEHAAL
jgi:hypothetical protein